jgi:Mrp family chromosome partitioning ATPase
MPALLAEARELADVVVIDSAPLGEVADALTIASEVDDILFVARAGHTNRRNLEIAADLLESIGRQATGIILVGSSGGLSNSYYQYGGEARSSGRRASSRGG